MKPLTVLPRATRDIRSAVIYYRSEAGEAVAIRFIQALERQYRAIARQPGIGSPRYADELGIGNLRSAAVKRFPYLIFYIELEDRIEVWRMLHVQRDIPELMQDR